MLHSLLPHFFITHEPLSVLLCIPLLYFIYITSPSRSTTSRCIYVAVINFERNVTTRVFLKDPIFQEVEFFSSYVWGRVFFVSPSPLLPLHGFSIGHTVISDIEMAGIK